MANRARVTRSVIFASVFIVFLIFQTREERRAEVEAETDAAAETVDGVLAPCESGEGPAGGLCGTLEVPEDRANPEGRRIALNILVLPATEEPEPDPVFFLAGGPGQAATEIAPLVSGALARVRESRDLVFVDQRGTGGSNRLDCEFDEDAPAAAGQWDFPEEELRECLAGFDADPALYTTPPAMDDLDAVRDALGYERINLWGGSYGTRAATVFLRRHPERVRSVILDGVAPVDMKLPLHFPADGQRALNLMLEACEAEPACRERFPDITEEIGELLAALDEDPPRRFRVQHPRTGEWEEVPVPAFAITALLRGILYDPTAAALAPLVIERALSGDYGPLMAFADSVGAVAGLAIGMHLSVLCAEDIPYLSDAEVLDAAEESVFDTFYYESVKQACSFWPRGELPGGYREPVASEAPVLILSGALDPVTPPRWGEHARATLPNARHVVAPAAGHGTLQAGCVPRLIAEFLDAGDASGLDPSCLDGTSRPPFWLSGTGPVPAREQGGDPGGAENGSGASPFGERVR